MRFVIAVALALACGGSTEAPSQAADEWRTVSDSTIRVFYRTADAATASNLLRVASSARAWVETFSGESIQSAHDVRVFADRPGFEVLFRTAGIEPACWMIARASRAGVELLSPRLWAAERCSHDGGDATEVERVVRHETVHVLHARLNALTEVNYVSDLKWFNEGVATFAAGQFDASMRARAASVSARGGVRLSTLANDPDLYSIGGSLAAFIDSTFGRAALVRAMRATSTSALLAGLGVSEAEFLARWARSLSP